MIGAVLPVLKFHGMRIHEARAALKSVDLGISQIGVIPAVDLADILLAFDDQRGPIEPIAGDVEAVVARLVQSMR
jgi:hypothetical protein